MNNSAYKPIACMSANNSHVYVWVSEYGCNAEDLEPYCGYLAMIPFGEEYSCDWPQLQLRDASYAGLMRLIKNGFTVRFPVDGRNWSDSVSKNIDICLNDSIR